MHALIVGAGVAGTVTAMALQQVGIEATIFESHPPSDGELGSYFTVTANGLEALAAIGARELAIAAGFPTRRNVLWNEAGRRLASLPLDSSVPGSPAAHTMKRSRMTRVLQERRSGEGSGSNTAGGSARPRWLRTVACSPRSTTAAALRATCSSGRTACTRSVRRAIDPNAPAGRLCRPDELWRRHARRREGHRARGLAPDLRAAGVLRLPGHAGRRRRVVRQRAAPTDHAGRACLDERGRLAATARSPLRRRRRPRGRVDRGRRARTVRRQHARPGPRPGLASWPAGHHRRRRARSRADLGTRCLDGDRGRDRPGRGARTGRRRSRRRSLPTSELDGSASRRSSPGAHAAAATRCPDDSGGSPATRCCGSSSGG